MGILTHALASDFGEEVEVAPDKCSLGMPATQLVPLNFLLPGDHTGPQSYCHLCSGRGTLRFVLLIYI